MCRIFSFVLGAVTALSLSACGSDEGTGAKGTGGSSASGNSSTGGIGSGTGGTGTATGGSGTGTATGGTGSSTGGTGSTTGGTGSTTGGTGSTTGGTGSTTGGSGGAATSGACQTACQKLLTAKCGDLTQADCTDSCAPSTVCTTESDSFYGCINSKGTVSCDAMVSLVSGCNTESTALSLCAACLPHSGENDCGTCTRSSCCSEVKTYLTASDIDGYDACVTPCLTQDMPQPCIDACVEQFPVAGKADSAISTCQAASCVDDCVCGPDSADTTCVACVKTSCCADFAAYVTASDVNDFATCSNACADTDTACVQDCVTQFPVAGDAYVTLIDECVSTTCASSCGG